MKPSKRPLTRSTQTLPAALRRVAQLGALAALTLPLCARFAVAQGYATGDEASEMPAPKGDPEARSRGLESIQRGAFGQAFPELLRASEKGDRIASYLCGVLLRRGLGVASDAPAARRAFEQAATGSQLFAMASTEFADCLILGYGGPKDAARGLAMLETAASAEHAPAMFKLGIAHMTGQGTERDPARAYAYFAVAADLKHAYALNNLVAIASRLSAKELARGKELRKSIVGAPKFRGGQIQFQMNFERAIDAAFTAALRKLDQGQAAAAIAELAMLARGNHGPSKLELARMHADGRGVKQDALEAAKLYASALGQCQGKALNALATCYAKGLGVSQDAQATLALRKAAAWRGHTDAQNRYGLAFVQGKGVQRSPVQAFVWWELAADGGHKHAKKNLGILLERDLPQDKKADAEKAYENTRARIARKIAPGWPRVELGTPAVFATPLPKASKIDGASPDIAGYESGDEAGDDVIAKKSAEKSHEKTSREIRKVPEAGPRLEQARSRDGKVSVLKPRGWTMETGDFFGEGTYGVTIDNADETVGLMFMSAPGAARRFRNSKECSERILNALSDTFQKLRILESFSSRDGTKTGVEASFEVEGVASRGFF